MNEIYRIADRKPEFPCWVWTVPQRKVGFWQKVYSQRLYEPERFGGRACTYTHWSQSDEAPDFAPSAQPTEPPSEKKAGEKALGHDYDSTGVGAAAEDTERIEFLERQRPFGVRLSWGFVDNKGGITIRPAPLGCDPKFSYATFREAVDAARLYFTPVPRKGAEKLSNVVPQTPPPPPPQPASDIHGKVIRAGTFPVRDEEITGLVVQCSREELERAPNLMYAEVTVSRGGQPDQPASEPTDAEMLAFIESNLKTISFMQYAKDVGVAIRTDSDDPNQPRHRWEASTGPDLRQAIRAAMSKGAK